MRTSAFWEIPPTAGMPAQLHDLLPPWRGNFSQQAAAFLHVPSSGVECSGSASLMVILSALKTLSSRRTVIIPA